MHAAIDPLLLASLTAPLEAALASDDPDALGAALARLCASGRLPDATFGDPCSVGYARRLVWEDPGGRYVLVGMTWGPRQGAPLHDHDGGWCAEGVVRGVLVETAYELIEHDERGHRFAERARSLAAEGAARVLVPPLEYHSVENPSSAVTYTLHLYAGRFRRCTQYRPTRDGWFRSEARTLGYDGQRG